MATVEGLQLRGSKYSLLVLIPKDLQASYGGKTRVVKSLGTSDKTEAVRKGLRLKAEWLEEFEAKRKALNPESLEVITPELAQALADSARKRVLKADSIRRDGNDPALNVLSRIADSRLPFIKDSNGSIKLPPRDSLEGLTAPQMLSLEILNNLQSEESGQHLARRNLLSVFPLLQADAKAMGFSISRETQGLKEALQRYLRSYRQAWIDVSRMDAGELIDLDPITPPEAPRLYDPSPTSCLKEDPESALTASEKLTLRDIQALWLKAERKTHDTKQASDRALSLAEECLGGPLYIHGVTRDQGNTFKAWLQDPARVFGLKTAKNHLMYVNSLLRFACVELEVIPKNPWQGLRIAAPKKATRVPWKPQELQQLFSQPLFQAYEVPAQDRAGGGPAAYWIPIIGLYTGARMGELAQLLVSDITEEDGVPVIRITDEGEGQSVKTSASLRFLPIHSELIRLGLLDYAEDVRKQNPKASLWPLLKNANIASAWFSKYRKSIGLDGRWLDFHSLRHTVRTRLAKAQVQEHLMDAITGHETGGSTGRKVYTHPEMEDLHQAVEQLSYESVDLPRVYPSRVKEQVIR